MKPPALMLNHSDSGVDTESESHSPDLLVELLAMNEEMVEQFCLERLSDPGQTEVLTGLIAQHEKTAQLLRAELAGIKAGHRHESKGVRVNKQTLRHSFAFFPSMAQRA